MESGTLRTINFETDKSFECQGRKFHLDETISVNRYRVLQKLNLEFGYSSTFHDVFKQIKLAWDKLNSLKLGEAAIILHNIMYGIVNLEDKHDPALRLCALFINEEGEDATVYDESKMENKIECWGGARCNPFFAVSSKLNSALERRLSRNFPKWFNPDGGTETRITRIIDDVDELDKYWNELLFSITKGAPSEMNELKRFDIFDFFEYIENKNKSII